MAMSLPPPLWPTSEVAYRIDSATGLTAWSIRGRDWFFANGFVGLVIGTQFVTLAAVPDWRSGLQWSIGFTAGRHIPPSDTLE